MALHTDRSSSYNCCVKTGNIILLSIFFLLLVVSASFFFLKKINSAGIFKSQKEEIGKGEISLSDTDSEDYGNFYLSIDKIGIKARVIRGVDPTDEEKYNLSLEDGVAHMTGTALPGSGKGNIFIYGHSSAAGDRKYGQIFAKIDDLKFGDKILVNYNADEYQYWVFEKKLVEKTDLSVLAQSDDERLTLMTCWPIGTDDRRLIVVAKKK